VDNVEPEIARRNWPVAWSAIWVGTLAVIVVGLLIGLLGLAVGAHEVSRFVNWKNVRLSTILFEVCGAFFSFVVGGWVASRIAGFRQAEHAMLHGAIVWALGLSLLLGLGSVGGTTHFGGWYAGFGGTPPWAGAVPSAEGTAAAALRNTAVAGLIAALLGLVGAVLGGWMASGEPMTLTYYRRRTLERGETFSRRAA
jgi:hypothetical protein